MSLIVESLREINFKIVYYGPGLCGKTTNLEHIHEKVDDGRLVSLSTEGERTLYFDFLPVSFGEIAGFTTRFHLYTVPGQVLYQASRQAILRGVDGVIFVADSQESRLDANLQSFDDLEMNIEAVGLDRARVPLVLQYNKRDLPGALSVEEMNEALNPGRLPAFEATATSGEGVFPSLKGVVKLVLEDLRNQS